MARLPQPGSDNGTWGDILNEYLSQTLKADGTLKDNVITGSALAPDAVTAAVIQDGTITEAQLDADTQNKLNTAGSGGVADGTITNAKLHDDAVTDVKVATGAAIAQSKIANLTTDLAGKAAASHTHPATGIADSTATGRAVLTAADAASARTAIGAGTSSLAIGTTNGTAKAGDYQPAAANITDSTATGRSLLTAADAATARAAIGAGTSSLVLGTTNSTAKAGDYAPTKADVGLANVDNTSDATKNSAAVTLTNKTIDGGNNTLQNIAQASVTGLTGALAGKVATTTTVNGHALSGNVTVTAADVLPTQTGNSGRYLTTDGTTASWSVVSGGGLGDTSTNTTSSVDGEAAVFSGTAGKTLRRATGTGVATLTSGVLGTISAPAGTIVGTTDSQTLTNKTINGGNNALTNIAISSLAATGTASASTYLRGDGSWATVSAGGGNMNTSTYDAAGINQQVVGTTAAQTLTNKRVTSRAVAISSSATPAINTDTTDVALLTALATNVSSMTTNLTGTPTDGQKLLLRIKDTGSPHTIAWGASFQSSGIATLPSTTAASKTHHIGLIYDAAISKWVAIAADSTGY